MSPSIFASQAAEFGSVRALKRCSLRIHWSPLVRLAATVAIAATVLFPSPRASVADEREHQLIAVLESDAPPQDKALTCKRLAVYGSDDAVPALEVLLEDQQLASWARIALEAIPGSAADEALRRALDKVEGRLLVGVINSLGVRRAAAAAGPLAERLHDPDAQVATAAAVALGRIGNPEATRVLEQSLATAPTSLRGAIAEGCILCAEHLLAGGKSNAAAALYDKVRTADVPKQRRLEATRGAILARHQEGIPLLVEQLRAADASYFALALHTSRELSGRQVTEALGAEAASTTPDRQARLILTLADRGDDAALPVILQAARSGPEPVRPVAIVALRLAGDVTCVPTLLQIATQDEAPFAQAAKETLAMLPGDGVDQDITARLPQATAQTRQVLIELVGLRRIEAMAPLVKALDDPQTEIRAAALTALGSTVAPDNLSVLIDRVAHPTHAEDLPTAGQALRAACVRMPDPDACAKQLVAAMSEASTASQNALLLALGSTGGETALAALAAAAKDPRDQLQDTASRLLGEWMTPRAAPALLDLAKTAPQSKYKVRALRGYIRIARQFDLPLAERIDMCRRALEVTRRDAERRLILEVLKRHPNLETLQLAVQIGKNASIEAEATAAALAIAQKIGGDSVELQQLLAQVDAAPVDLEILKAEYGVGDKTKDVTALLRKHVGRLPLVILPSPSYNASFGGDPAPGVPKRLKIRYRLGGKLGEATFAENAPILLPMPQ